MQIQCDTREKKSELARIERQFNQLGVQSFRSKLYVGDYQSLDNARLVVDRKQDLQELCGNVAQQHERFRAELMRAKEAGIHIVILCEHGDDIKTLEDVYFWINPRTIPTEWVIQDGHPVKVAKSPNGVTGPQLYKCLTTIRDRYDVEFVFCSKDETGARIVQILGDSDHGKD
jgi:hypothetical protein